jgi:SAM-dependent methyltransferase
MKTDKLRTPGHCDQETTNRIDKRAFENFVKFINPVGKCADIGEQNAKIEHIKKHFNIEVEQVDAPDFNYPFKAGKYDTIFCFEVIEHLANQLLFMESIMGMMHPDSVLYISFPSRPGWLYTSKHYNEIMPDRFTDWILNALGLYIVRQKKIRVEHPFWFYLTGIRPFFRLFYGYTTIYEIRIKQ